MMTPAQVVQTSVIVTDNSPFQDYPHPDDHTTRSTVNPGFIITSNFIEFQRGDGFHSAPSGHVFVSRERHVPGCISSESVDQEVISQV